MNILLMILFGFIVYLNATIIVQHLVHKEYKRAIAFKIPLLILLMVISMFIQNS